MAIHSQEQADSTTDLLQPEERYNNTLPSPTKDHHCRRFLEILSYVCLFVGTVVASVLSRFYFQHGGSNRWLATLVQSAGFPLFLLPVFLSPSSTSRRCFNLPRHLFLLSLVLGILLGVNNLLVSCGTSYLPVSTSSLLLSTQLAFTLVLSAVIVRIPLTFTNLNAVILITLSSLLLAFQKSSGGDKLPGESWTQYYLGFAATLGAAFMFAAYLPVMEIVYRGVDSFRMVMEVQFAMEAAATALSATGMAMTRDDWKENWDLGPTAYWIVLGATVLSWQLCFMGTAGTIYLTSSLHSGICMTALLPINVMAGVFIFGDDLGPEKIVAVVLCVWGFASYLYGESKKNEDDVIKGHAENKGVVDSIERKHGSVDAAVENV
ncbi:purine permease 11 [Rhynchospora pubera]|uniref:Probable purine permease n=1 Tax=Rhynchospora pubera TaxID=906938 RepID=A0AAV8EQ43_9POAL|nr:purine permease 11 [Rhynchospora pubera]